MLSPATIIHNYDFRIFCRRYDEYQSQNRQRFDPIELENERGYQNDYRNNDIRLVHLYILYWFIRIGLLVYCRHYDEYQSQNRKGFKSNEQNERDYRNNHGTYDTRFVVIST